MNPADRDEAIQDMMATAYAGYKSLVDRGLYDNIYRSTLGKYAVRSYRGGRRFYGNRSKDVMDPLCQMQGRADVRGHVFYDASSHQWIEILIYDRTHDPALIGEFNIDYENWWETLSDKQCELLDDFLLNESTNDIARKNNLSTGRISQIRRELIESFNTFVGNVEASAS